MKKVIKVIKWCGGLTLKFVRRAWIIFFRLIHSGENYDPFEEEEKERLRQDDIFQRRMEFEQFIDLEYKDE